MTFDPLAWLPEALQQLERDNLRRQPAIRGSAQGPKIVMDAGERINFGSNDYLGLSADPRLATAVAQSLKRFGWGSGASPLITGRSAPQAELERHLAALKQTEAALVFPSGFAANAGTLGCLAGPDDVILSDAKNHASLIDGCRLSRATVRVYRHLDVTDLRAQLTDCSSYRRRLIVTDSLFSMDGDMAPLPTLVELAEQHEALLVVDEAHATGVFGTRGSGLCEMMRIESLVPVRIGTLSKAIGSIGGFVAGSKLLIDWLFNRARSYVFSTALPAACHAASLTALKIIRDEPQRRALLLETQRRLREELSGQGWQIVPGDSQIIPVRIGEPAATMRLAQMLSERGLLVPGIRPPTVPAGESLLRISLCATHSQQQIERLVAAMKDARK
ncbi:MAG: 8-amino-7-oxononanoate synthase [Planctomycetales bacterium]|nr:8-amino-7-oxononanoate synthase [Planctomycetales bacterium]MCA9166729.1 8-amino-7-oxononanoate synthase [Planctomycetales bacterium]